MKIDISSIGVLEIRSEKPIESYALRKWAEDNNIIANSDRLSINTDYDRVQECKSEDNRNG